MPENDGFSRTDFSRADMVKQTCECLSRVNRIGQQSFRSREQANRFVRRFVRLLISRLEIAAIDGEIICCHAHIAAQPRQRRIGKRGASPLVAFIFSADGNADDFRTRLQRLMTCNQTGKRSAVPVAA